MFAFIPNLKGGLPVIQVKLLVVLSFSVDDVMFAVFETTEMVRIHNKGLDRIQKKESYK